MLNRRKTREALLAVFYAHEISEIELNCFINDKDNFTDWIFKEHKEETIELIRDELIVIYEDVKHFELDGDDVITFRVPKFQLDYSLTSGQLSEGFKTDNFF